MDVVWVAWLVLVLLGVRFVFAVEWRLEVLWLRVAWWGGVSLFGGSCWCKDASAVPSAGAMAFLFWRLGSLANWIVVV